LAQRIGRCYRRLRYVAVEFNQLCSGTKWPMAAPARALGGLDELHLDVPARELFPAGNALRVFGLDAFAA
jgi:hypothetical protein